MNFINGVVNSHGAVERSAILNTYLHEFPGYHLPSM
jgi:hypothetical protein